MTTPEAGLAAHASFDDIEAAFHDALDVSLDPRGPDSLYDVVASLELPPGSSVVDVGCGRGRQAAELVKRFGFDVLGVDPVGRHEGSGLARFADGTAEALPVATESVDLVFSRESLMFPDIDAAAAEFRRVLRPGGRGLVYLVLTGPRMSDAEAAELATLLQGKYVRPAQIERALVGAGLLIDERIDYASEWGERGQEAEGVAGGRLLYAARLIREPDRYIEQFGQESYDIMLGDCLWHVYRMLGKLVGYACVFTKP